jgi:hypothetical protein
MSKKGFRYLISLSADFILAYYRPFMNGRGGKMRRSSCGTR